MTVSTGPTNEADFPKTSRGFCTDAEVAELRAILADFSDSESAASLLLLMEDGYDIGEVDIAKDTPHDVLLRVADVHPIETALAVIAVLTADAMVKALSL